MARDGFCLLRNVIDREAVLEGQRSISRALADHGWHFADRAGLELADDHPRPCGWSAQNGSPHSPSLDSHTIQALMQTPEILRVVEGPELFGLFGRLFGEPASTLDMKWLRCLGPAAGPAGGGLHMDNVYMSRGSSELTTAWVPCCDVPVELGGLVVLRGSNSLPGFQRLRDQYGEIDVDRSDLPSSFSDPVELAALDRGSRWMTANYRAGDVVLFTMKTLHGGLRNETPSTLRISCDLRFQPASDPSASHKHMSPPAESTELTNLVGFSNQGTSVGSGSRRRCTRNARRWPLRRRASSRRPRSASSRLRMPRADHGASSDPC